MRFLTSKGVLDVGEKQLLLTESNGSVVECPKHIEVVNQMEAETVARAMHDLANRFSEGAVDG